jgi:CBS domain-containing protein
MPSRPVSEVIGKRPVPAASIVATVIDAARIMKKNHTSAVLVVDEGILVGIITERDIAYRVVAEHRDPATTKVDAVMTRKMQTIAPEKPFSHALHMMYEGGFRHVPVIDRAGHPLGLLAAHDALDIDGLRLEQELERREEITVIL